MTCVLIAVAAGFAVMPVVPASSQVQELADVKSGNGRMLPKVSTLRSLPWATAGKHRVGEFLCEMAWMPSYRQGSPQFACPRYVARQQLQCLDNFGLKLYSTFEAEFSILRREDKTPIFGGPVHAEVCTSQLLAEFESFLYDTEKMLFAGGIDVSKLHTEYGPGQVEFVPQPQYGIGSPDSMFRLHQAMKELCLQRNWMATFMALVSCKCDGNCQFG